MSAKRPSGGGGSGKPRGAAASRTRPYEAIRAAIRSGEFAPNQPLTETALAEWCGVSRTPVREALTRLQNEGLIERTPRGPVVRVRTIEEIFNIYEVRIALEAMAARSAAERHTARDIVVLRASLERYEASTDEQPADRVLAARSFHEAVWRAARNDTLFETLARLDSLVPRYPNAAIRSAATLKRNHRQHREILAAIQAGDGARAAEAATVHYTESRDIRLKDWSSFDGLVETRGELADAGVD